MSHKFRVGRRDYRCALCGETIPKGQPHATETFKPWDHVDNDSFGVFRAHEECYLVLQGNWPDLEHYPQDPGVWKDFLGELFPDISPEAAIEGIRATGNHIRSVREKLEIVVGDLLDRGEAHDFSKFSKEEIVGFVASAHRLSRVTFGSEEYHEQRRALGTALEHHYDHNPHHPQFWDSGISGMSLCDLVEMFTDWLAAVERHDDGDIYASIEHNAERFGISDQLKEILLNTARRWNG